MKNLSTHLKESNIDKSLIEILEHITQASAEINQLLRKGALGKALGCSETINIQGEQQAKLDIISNEILKNSLIRSSHIKSIASEEEEFTVAGDVNGNYVIAYDPLDGSSNIDINAQVGTIFSIFPAKSNIKANDAAQFFQSGHNQVCAGYILYGPSTQLVIAVNGSVSSYTLNETLQFILTHEKLQIPESSNNFAINMSNSEFWDDNCKAYIHQLQQGKFGPRKTKFNMRWNGAMVGDVHRLLLKGGIFLYPTNHLNDGKSIAKLRLLYEAFPMALIIKLAGGKAYSSDNPILEQEISSLHQRTAVILGSSSEVDQYLCNRQ